MTMIEDRKKMRQKHMFSCRSWSNLNESNIFFCYTSRFRTRCELMFFRIYGSSRSFSLKMNGIEFILSQMWMNDKNRKSRKNVWSSFVLCSRWEFDENKKEKEITSLTLFLFRVTSILRVQRSWIGGWQTWEGGRSEYQETAYGKIGANEKRMREKKICKE